MKLLKLILECGEFFLYHRIDEHNREMQGKPFYAEQCTCDK